MASLGQETQLLAHAAPSLRHSVASGQLSWRALARLAWCMAHFQASRPAFLGSRCQVYDAPLLDALQEEPSHSEDLHVRGPYRPLQALRSRCGSMGTAVSVCRNVLDVALKEEGELSAALASQYGPQLLLRVDAAPIRDGSGHHV